MIQSLLTHDVKFLAATLLHMIGPEGYNTLTWESPGDEKKIDKILETFEEYCIPQKNITWERHIFNTHE